MIGTIAVFNDEAVKIVDLKPYNKIEIRRLKEDKQNVIGEIIAERGTVSITLSPANAGVRGESITFVEKSDEGYAEFLDSVTKLIKAQEGSYLIIG